MQFHPINEQSHFAWMRLSVPTDDDDSFQLDVAGKGDVEQKLGISV